MQTYIALLRGINVGGQKKIKMVELRSTLEKLELKEVRTYIQSGNIVFASDKTNKNTIAELIHSVIKTDFGFSVPTLVVTAREIEEILDKNPFSEEEAAQLYFVLLKNVPNQDLVEEFNAIKFENEEFHISDRCVYLNCKTAYGKAKLGNNLIERKLKVEATTRNLRTMKKLVEMAKS